MALDRKKVLQPDYREINARNSDWEVISVKNDCKES